MRITLTYDVTGLEAIFARAENVFADMSVGPMGHAFAQVGLDYLAFSRQRFVSASVGDGTWKPLAESTKRQRKTPEPHLILRDNDDLFQSLKIDSPDNIFSPFRDGIVVGTKDFKAKFHQGGGRKLPRRMVLVAPDASTRNKMRAVLIEAANKTVQAISTKAA